MASSSTSPCNCCDPCCDLRCNSSMVPFMPSMVCWRSASRSLAFSISWLRTVDSRCCICASTCRRISMPSNSLFLFFELLALLAQRELLLLQRAYLGIAF